MIDLSEIKGSSQYEANKAHISNDTPQMDLTPIQEEIMAPMQESMRNNDGFEYSDETNELLRHHQQLLDEEQEYCHLCDLKAWVEKSRPKYYGLPYLFYNVLKLINSGVLVSKEQIKAHFRKWKNSNYIEYIKENKI